MADSDRETATVLTPKFDADGLMSAIAVDAASNQILMLAHMNAEALERTVATGFAHYYSRSRNSLWKKGESSGETQKIVEILVDCDQDALLLVVEPQGRGAACHTGQKSCFYRRLDLTDGKTLAPTGAAPLFDPQQVYKK